MDEAKANLLIIEDDLDIAEMLRSYFSMQGYEVNTANWGEDGVKACLASPPDLVILDIRLPDIDGFEVAARLRANRRTRSLPIIFLTEKRERADRLQGLSLKAEDYITKPFDIQELRLRVSNALERSRRSSLTHTVTGLPEGDLVDENLQECVNDPASCISVLSLKNLGRFREVYGFVASDDVLRAVAMMVQNVLKDHDPDGSFIGHLDQTSFVLITHPDMLPLVKDQIRKRLSQSLDYFYRDQDRESELFRGYRLAVEIYDFTPGPNPPKNLTQLKAALEGLYR